MNIIDRFSKKNSNMKFHKHTLIGSRVI